MLFCDADMQKFPLRMKDNDLLVTELYKDPSGNRITALSVYLTQKASSFMCMTFYFTTDNVAFLVMTLCRCTFEQCYNLMDMVTFDFSAFSWVAGRSSGL